MPFYAQLKDAIEAASRSPTAFAACLVLVFAGLAFSWFSASDTRVKVGAFAALFVAAGVLFWTVYAPPAPPAPGPSSGPSAGAQAVARGNYVVDLQFTGARDKALAVQAALRRKGWVVYGIDEVGGFEPSLVKWSADSNTPAAQALRDDVSGLSPPVLPVRFSRDGAIKPTHLELWVGFR